MRIRKLLLLIPTLMFTWLLQSGCLSEVIHNAIEDAKAKLKEKIEAKIEDKIKEYENSTGKSIDELVCSSGAVLDKVNELNPLGKEIQCKLEDVQNALDQVQGTALEETLNKNFTEVLGEVKAVLNFDVESINPLTHAQDKLNELKKMVDGLNAPQEIKDKLLEAVNGAISDVQAVDLTKILTDATSELENIKGLLDKLEDPAQAAYLKDKLGFVIDLVKDLNDLDAAGFTLCKLKQLKKLIGDKKPEDILAYIQSQSDLIIQDTIVNLTKLKGTKFEKQVKTAVLELKNMLQEIPDKNQLDFFQQKIDEIQKSLANKSDAELAKLAIDGLKQMESIAEGWEDTALAADWKKKFVAYKSDLDQALNATGVKCDGSEPGCEPAKPVEPEKWECRALALSSSYALHSINLKTGVLVVYPKWNLQSTVQRVLFSGDFAITISYNATSKQNEIHKIGLADGQVTLVKSFPFDSGYYLPETFLYDPGKNAIYVVSSSKTLYSLNLNSGELSTGPKIQISPQAMILGKNDLVAISFNETTKQNEVHKINPADGTATLVKSFTFDTGYHKPLTFSYDSGNNSVYDVSSSNTLYSLKLDSGELAAAPQLEVSPQGMAAVKTSLVAIDYNSSNKQSEIQKIDLSSGKAALIKSFTFDSSSWIPRFQVQCPDGLEDKTTDNNSGETSGGSSTAGDATAGSGTTSGSTGGSSTGGTSTGGSGEKPACDGKQVDTGEECDGTNLNGAWCGDSSKKYSNYGTYSGNPKCTACKLDWNGCVFTGKVCKDANGKNGTMDENGKCIVIDQGPKCGDMQVEQGEECEHYEPVAGGAKSWQRQCNQLDAGYVNQEWVACSQDCKITGKDKCKKAGDSCNAGTPTTKDAKYSTSGECVGTPTKVGQACDDGNSCTQKDKYDTAEKCLGVPSTGASCDDKNVATGNDKCQPDASCKGESLVGKPCPLTSPDKCTYPKGKYDAAGQCIPYPWTNQACDDGNPLTNGDKCGADFKCQGVSIVGKPCDDKNAATKDDKYDASGKCAGIFFCGNKQVDSGEKCDGDVACNQYSNASWASGTAKCVNCLSFDFSNCVKWAPSAQCDSGQLEGDELCDGKLFKNLSSDSCKAYNSSVYFGGNIKCGPKCNELDFSACLKEGSPCNDGNIATSNDKYTADGKCVGEYSMVAPGAGAAKKEGQEGQKCNDNNVCTTNDQYNAKGVCTGILNTKVAKCTKIAPQRVPPPSRVPLPQR